MNRTLNALTLALVLVATPMFASTAHAAAPAEPLSAKPALVAKKLLNAIEDGEAAKACSLMTKEYADRTAATHAELTLHPDATCSDSIKFMSHFIVEDGGYGAIVSKTISMNGSKARVKLTADLYDEPMIFTLRRINGNWRIHDWS